METTNSNNKRKSYNVIKEKTVEGLYVIEKVNTYDDIPIRRHTLYTITEEEMITQIESGTTYYTEEDGEYKKY